MCIVNCEEQPAAFYSVNTSNNIAIESDMQKSKVSWYIWYPLCSYPLLMPFINRSPSGVKIPIPRLYVWLVRTTKRLHVNSWRRIWSWCDQLNNNLIQIIACKLLRRFDITNHCQATLWRQQWNESTHTTLLRLGRWTYSWIMTMNLDKSEHKKKKLKCITGTRSSFLFLFRMIYTTMLHGTILLL